MNTLKSIYNFVITHKQKIPFLLWVSVMIFQISNPKPEQCKEVHHHSHNYYYCDSLTKYAIKIKKKEECDGDSD